MYKYHYRPEFGSSKFLIEFFCEVENDKFLSSLLNTISELKPIINDITDLWVNDEILFNITSEMGDFTISKDNLGFAFIIAENNQECLSKINLILEVSENFEKIDVDFENYKFKKSYNRTNNI